MAGLAATTATAVLAQAAPLSIFDPVSLPAKSIVDLSLLVLAITGGIFLVVTGVLIYCLLNFQQPVADGTEPPQVYGSFPIEVAWIAGPLMIVFILVLVTTRTLWEVEVTPPLPRPDDGALFVTVIGRQWWWEYRYESFDGRTLGFVTANELHLPAGTEDNPAPVFLSLESADVCHSFWVPQLAGKVDLIPGRRNSLWIQTNQPGLYLGQCAEYCGTQHANMLLSVEVQPHAEFEDWLLKQQAPAKLDGAFKAGRQVFESLTCINCHTVRGTAADGTYGPDLTHLMSRRTLASGRLPNTREDLRDWILNPHDAKPGCLMPAFALDDSRMNALLDYLESLE